MKNHNPFRYFKTSHEVIRLAVMMYVRFPLSLRNVEDLLHERGIDICHETVRYWWNRFAPFLLVSFGRNGFTPPLTIQAGVGMWVRRSSKSMVKRATSGVPSITKERCLRPSFEKEKQDRSLNLPQKSHETI